MEEIMITKEQLLNEVGDFTWDFGQCFFIETRYGNFIWSDPDYNGDNTMMEYSGSIQDFFSSRYGLYGRGKGNHLISRYCGDKFTVIEEKK
jgi:hypothetical protein